MQSASEQVQTTANPEPLLAASTTIPSGEVAPLGKHAKLYHAVHTHFLSKRNDEVSQRLAAIVDSSDDAIVGKNLEGIITSWNRGAERIFGYTPSEAIGKSITMLVPWDRREEEVRILTRIRRGERVDHFETVRQRKDGTLIEISLTISPIKDSSGTIVGASKIARDITERKRAERQQVALYELVSKVNRAAAMPDILEAAIEAICRCQDASRASILQYDSDRVMRFKAWRGLSDEYRQAVEGHSPWRPDDPAPEPVCIDDVSKVPLEEGLRQVIAREGIRALAFIPLMGGHQLLGKFMVYYDCPHAFTLQEMRTAQTVASQVVFAIERHKSSEELERLVNERTASLREAIGQMEEFSYSVSHDLRAPLRAIHGFADAVLEDYGDQVGAEGKSYLERIVQNSTRMERLMNDVLTYSRVSRREVCLEPVCLDKLVRDTVRHYPEFDAAQIVIEASLSDVLGHEPSLSQAIGNLLNNAVKFVLPGKAPRIVIRTEQTGDKVRLWIEDNGIGIKPEYQSRLFGMFERIHPEGAYEGNGIGLAIVRKAVERMGGQVGVESDGCHGSQFWIQLRAVN